MSKRKKWIAVALVAAIVIGAGVFALTQKGGTNIGTVSGTVQLVSNTVGKVPKLDSAQVIFSANNGSKASRTVSVGASGHFTVTLPPGSWSANAEAAYNRGNGQIGNGCSVSVTAGQTSTVRFELDVSDVNGSLCF